MTPLRQTLERLDRAPRTASLIVTVWGDAVVPRGGSLWLGTLQAILDRFGCNQGQVRTAMSRLTEEGWLRRARQGRLSFYRLGPRGEAGFATASHRIYDAPRAGGLPAWDGAFRLVLGSGDTTTALAEAGFVPLAPGVLLATDEAVGGLPADQPVLLARPRHAADAVAVAARAWPSLAAVAAGYASFADAFGLLDRTELALPEAEALPLRLLLVHEYRRVALRDPDLPAALLPEGWPGAAARALAARVYRRLLPASEAWLTAHGVAEDGPLPLPAPGVLEQRFRDG
jgi:phenylacetic acid degradation operon negative regulatory protein